jgi:hypothetical protein
MTWLATYYIYVLTVTASGGLASQLGVYSTPQACEAARTVYAQQQTVKDMALRAECTERVRTVYPGR